MRKIIRIFVWILAAIVLLAAGLFTYLRNADLSAYQDRVESFLSARIGHELDIRGRFELHFGATTRLVAEDVVLLNPEWKADPMLAKVGHLTLAFETVSLLSRPFIVEEFFVNAVGVRVERANDDQLNWSTTAVSQGGGDGEPFDPSRLAIRVVNIQDVVVEYIDADRPRPIRVAIENFSIRPDLNDILDLDLRGTVNDMQLWADGKLGPWQNIISGREIFSDLSLTLGQLQLTIDGTVEDPMNLEGVLLNAELSGPDISNVLERIAVPPFASGSYEVTAEIEQHDTGHRIRVDGNLGQIELLLSGNVDKLLLPQDVRHDFSVSGPDAHFVAELFGIDAVPAAPFQVSGDYSRSGSDLVFRDTLLSIGQNSLSIDGDVAWSSGIPDFELHVTAAGPDFSIAGPFLSLPGLPQEAFTASGHVSKGGKTWRATDIVAAVGDHHLTISGEIETGSRSDTTIDIRASGPDISVVQKFTDLQGIPARPYEVVATLQSDPEGIRVDNGVGIFGDHRIELGGVIAVNAGAVGTVVDVAARGPELNNVALLTGVPYLPRGVFDLSGRMRIGRGAIYFDDLSAEVGALRGTASGQIALAERIGDFDLDISVQGPDVSLLPEVELLQQFVGDPFQVNGQLLREGDRITTSGLHVTLGELVGEVQGYLVGAAQLIDLSVVAEAANSEVIKKLSKLAYLPSGNVLLSGKIEKNETDITFTDTALSIGEFRAEANGSLSLSPRSNDSDLAFTIAGPSLTEVGLVLGSDALPSNEFSVSGQFHGTPSGFAVQNFLAELGENNLRGKFDADLTGKPRIVGELSSSHLDLSAQFRAPDNEALTQAPDTGDEKKFFFPDGQLDTSWLQHADIDVRLSIDEFIANTLNVTDVEIGVRLQDGALRIDPFQLSESSGSVEGSFSLAPEDGLYKMQSSLTVDDMHIGLSVSDDQSVSDLPNVSGHFQLSGVGSSVHTIMASSNGTSSFRQGSGKVKEVFGSALFKDVLLQVLRTLNPMRRSRGYEILECGIYEVTVVDGRATIDTFAIQTDTMTTVARGTINFRNEKLDIAFRAKPREGIGISLGTVANQLLELRGTLKEPRIRVDAGRTATTTGAAVATGGLSLLARGLWDRLSAEASICEEVEN